VVDTGVGDIDDNLEEAGYIETLTLVSSGTSAVLTTGLVDGAVSFITISNRGNDFTSLPRVAISSAPSGGVTAVGIASMRDDLVDYDGEKSYKIQRIDIINPGSGYTVAPDITVVGGGGAGFAATAGITDGAIGIVTITSGGTGYSTVPTITFSGAPGTGTTATAVAYVGSGNTVGIVTQIGITNAGAGYTVAPAAHITIPYSGGSGNYIFNEVVTGAASSATGRVKSWDASTMELNVSITTGAFTVGEVITGSTSGATYEYQIVAATNTDDGFAENTSIQSAGDSIIDFTETNPFGMP
jgi:hypothetical protein